MMRVLSALLLLTATALAAPPPRIAIAPLDKADAAIERALLEAAKEASLEVVNAANGKLAGKPAFGDPSQRAQALARETSAQRVLLVEASRLGDGRVLYLQGFDSGGKLLGSTTVALQRESGEVAPTDRPALRGGLVRVLAPAKYVGRLQLKVDVPNAQVLVDARPVGSPAAPIDLPVGTHALRVTHPAYRDFLRFVEIDFDKTVPIEVALSAYPLAEGEMTERLRKQNVTRPRVPWWRSWWALSVAGVVITGVTAGAILLARPTVTYDHKVDYTATPSP